MGEMSREQDEARAAWQATRPFHERRPWVTAALVTAPVLVMLVVVAAITGAWWLLVFAPLSGCIRWMRLNRAMSGFGGGQRRSWLD